MPALSLTKTNRAFTADSAALIGSAKANKNMANSTELADQRHPLRPKLEIGPSHHRFRLLRKISEGDQETVWLAIDLSIKRHQNQLKLLKILNRGNSTEANNYPAAAKGIADLPRIALARLRARIERIACLNHPNIVQIYGWHQGEDGWPFIEIEYMDHRNGYSLDQILRRKGKSGLSWEQTLKLLKPIVAALDYAHSKHGLAHHNLKSANIFIARNGIVKIMDFDLTHQARSAHSDDEPRSTLLASASAAQQRLKQDIIALAALIYEMLTGQLPCLPESLTERHNTRWPVLPGGRQSTETSALSSRVLSKLELQRPARLTRAAWNILQSVLKRQTEDYPATLGAFIEQLTYAQTQGDGAEHHVAAIVPTNGCGEEPITLLKRTFKVKSTVNKKQQITLQRGSEIGSAGHRFKLMRLLEASGDKQVWLANRLSEQPDNQRLRVLKIMLPPPENLASLHNLRPHNRQPADSAAPKLTAIPEEVIAATNLLVKLNHPNIAQVYGWHHSEEGWSFLEIEYIDHRSSYSLQRLLLQEDKSGLPCSQVFDLLWPIAIAVDYAHHKHGLAHCNLKPANIFITQEGNIKVTDFNFGSQPLGFQKDIVALAALTYQLLTGQPPYQQDTLLGRDPNRWSSVLAEHKSSKQIIAAKPSAEPIPPKPAVLTDAAWKVLKQILTHQQNIPFRTAIKFVYCLNEAQNNISSSFIDNAQQNPVRINKINKLIASLVLAIATTAGAYSWVDGRVDATDHYPPARPAVTATAKPGMQQPLTTSTALSNAVSAPNYDNTPTNHTSDYEPKRSNMAIQETTAAATVAELSNAMAKGNLFIGMSQENILVILGTPVRIVNEGEQLEGWVYREGGTKWIVEVRNGRLWQVSKVVLY